MVQEFWYTTFYDRSHSLSSFVEELDERVILIKIAKCFLG